MASLPAYQVDRRTIALHEAGHAVLCCLIGVAITGAHVDPDGLSGKVKFAVSAVRVDKPHLPQDVLEHAAIQLATMYVGGEMAELLHHGLDVESWHYLLLDTSDWESARKVLWMAFRTAAPLFYCQRLARAMLTEHWAWVQSVADVIELKGVVDGDNVKRLGLMYSRFK